ncbi:redoxin domain-containing protein [Actinotalea ferrariae]|uniref:NHL domain-containing thioredoxin family protein n=1 Tax=Actinotalea ferrariae TaxID=1386098 RepID=UPI001C8C82C4|nr:NHL domain-containing thioredoxin family protein [Actinotalea ferrariae]MBX9243482.1 redoxin domain-containing protein [Actinotalea ferrariae]
MTQTAQRLPKVRASELVGRGWLNTGGQDVTLADLRGKIVLLDFWTFCCINCLHVLDELRELEEQYRDVLVVVGVHSPKFVHEADPVALAAAVDRYEVHHPVLDDPELTTWSAYSARAWPTLVVVDPEGYIVAHMAGEGHKNNLAVLVRELVAEHEAKGTLHRGDGPYVPPPAAETTLRFPAKALRLPNGNLLVADAGHHSLAELEADGETLVRRIGSGERGLVDGGPDEARFSEPNGLGLVPEELRSRVGYDVVVADTVNHALRGVRLDDGSVRTLAGTGQQYMVGAADNVLADDALDEVTPPAAVVAGAAAFTSSLTIALGADQTAQIRGVDAARRQKLSSPWDVVWFPPLAAFVVAMAGNHTLWAFDPEAGTIEHLAGTMNEGLLDGPGGEAWFAQTSGLALDPAGRLWLADSEVSALRFLEAQLPADDDGQVVLSKDGLLDATRVGTAVGAGLFDFGHRDGPASQALLQHPLGVAVLPDGSIAIADTYNGAIRRYAPGVDGEGEVTTLARDLAEPSGLLVDVGDDGAVDLLVVESAAHRLTRLRLPAKLAGELLDHGAHRTQRPVSEVGAGEVRLDVVFTPATGQKYDDRYGPSTRLQVSSTPPELLLDGAGDDVPLERVLRINPAVSEGVLHVTAQAASCDADPAIEFPACHLNQQDWGVPVRVVDGGPGVLTLPLHG